MLYSMQMTFKEVQGGVQVDAPWQVYPVQAASCEEAYWEALRRRKGSADDAE